MDNDFWVLCDPQTKTQTEKLSTEEAQFSLLKMKTKDIDKFLIWKNSWPKWKKLKDFLSTDESPFMSIPPSPHSEAGAGESNTVNLLKMKPLDQNTEKNIQASFSQVQLEEINLFTQSGAGKPQFDGDQLTDTDLSSKSELSFKNITSKTSADKSADKYKIELLLINPTKETLFRAKAENISLSGTNCDKLLPTEFYEAASFDLVIINNFIPDPQYSKLTVKAKAVVRDTLVYLEYINLDNQQKESLRAMLDYYVRSSKKIQS